MALLRSAVRAVPLLFLILFFWGAGRIRASPDTGQDMDDGIVCTCGGECRTRSVWCQFATPSHLRAALKGSAGGAGPTAVSLKALRLQMIVDNSQRDWLSTSVVAANPCLHSFCNVQTLEASSTRFRVLRDNRKVETWVKSLCCGRSRRSSFAISFSAHCKRPPAELHLHLRVLPNGRCAESCCLAYSRSEWRGEVHPAALA